MTGDPVEIGGRAAVFDAARRADAAGDPVTAETGFRTVIAMATDARDDRILRARALMCLAVVCRCDGRLDEADVHARAAFDQAVEVDDAAIVSAAAAEIAQVDLEFDRLDGALGHAETAVVNALAIPDPRARDQASALALQTRAAAWRAAGDEAMAEGDLLEAQRRAKAGFGPESLEVASVLSDLGSLRTHRRDFERAGIALRRARGMVVRVAGMGHADVAVIERQLAVLELGRGELAAAATHGRRALHLHAASLGEDHLLTAQDRVTLAVIVSRTGALDEATGLLAAALPIFDAQLGPDHPDSVAVRRDLDRLAQHRAALPLRRSTDMAGDPAGETS